MKRIIKLTESDLYRIVRRVINEGLSVSDTGELVGDFEFDNEPDHELGRILAGFSKGQSDFRGLEKMMSEYKYIKMDFFKFGFLNIEKNDYVLIKLDKNNGDQLFQHPNKNNIILFKDGYWYDSLNPKGPFTLGDKNPHVIEGGIATSTNKIYLNDIEIFHDFAMDMVNNGIDKYYVRVRD
jgi:hypothetical protein